MLRTNLFQTWHDDRNYWILQFDTSQCLTIHCGKLDIDANFNELDLHERSQGCEKDFMIILSQSPQSVICIWNAVETCVFVEAQSFDDMTVYLKKITVPDTLWTKKTTNKETTDSLNCLLPFRSFWFFHEPVNTLLWWKHTIGLNSWILFSVASIFSEGHFSVK